MLLSRLWKAVQKRFIFQDIWISKMVLQWRVGTIVETLGMGSESYRPQLDSLVRFLLEEAWLEGRKNFTLSFLFVFKWVGSSWYYIPLLSNGTKKLTHRYDENYCVILGLLFPEIIVINFHSWLIRKSSLGISLDEFVIQRKKGGRGGRKSHICSYQ